MSKDRGFEAFEKVGGPAFPSDWRFPSGESATCPGMTLRDWFAGQALAGLISSSEAHFRGDSSDKAAIAEWRAEVDRRWAGYCYEMADAMLKAREGGTP